MDEKTTTHERQFDIHPGIIGFGTGETWLVGDLSYFLGELSSVYESLAKVYYGLYLVDAYDRHVAIQGDDRNSMIGTPALLGAKLLAGLLPHNDTFHESELEPWHGEHAYMRLTVSRIQIASPGWLEFFGNLNPLKLIFDFIIAWRKEERNHQELHERIRGEDFARAVSTWNLLYAHVEDLPKDRQDAAREKLMTVLLKLMDSQTNRLMQVGDLPQLVDLELRQRISL